MRESTYIVLTGLLANGQAVDFADVQYVRTVRRLKLIANAQPPSEGPTTIGLKVDGVATAEQYALPLGQSSLGFDVAGAGLALAAESVLTAFVVAHGGAADVAVWIESDVTPQPGEDENWIVLTAGMLQSRISSMEYETITATTIQSGQADPVPQILADITQKVRAAVRSGRKTALGQAGTIPGSLKNAALTISKYELFGRISSLRSFLEVIEPDWRAALKELELVAKGEITPEAPADPLDTEPTNTAAWGSDEKVAL